MGAYIVKCTGVEKNADGSIAAIHCTADLETGNGNPADGRKVKGTIHWVSAAHAVDAEVRLYDKLFTEANMNAIPEGSDYKDYLNPESVVVCKGCKLEESLKDAKPGEKFQFVRTGFFTPDSKNPGVYNRVVTLRDSFKPASEKIYHVKREHFDHFMKETHPECYHHGCCHCHYGSCARPVHQVHRHCARCRQRRQPNGWHLYVQRSGLPE